MNTGHYLELLHGGVTLGGLALKIPHLGHSFIHRLLLLIRFALVL